MTPEQHAEEITRPFWSAGRLESDGEALDNRIADAIRAAENDVLDKAALLFNADTDPLWWGDVRKAILNLKHPEKD